MLIFTTADEFGGSFIHNLGSKIPVYNACVEIGKLVAGEKYSKILNSSFSIEDIRIFFPISIVALTKKKKDANINYSVEDVKKSHMQPRLFFVLS